VLGFAVRHGGLEFAARLPARVYGRMLQSFGLAFLFIPINVSAFAYVPKELTNMGTGIINLARNIGASVGIATVTTWLERRTQAHTARLVEHANPFSLAYQKMLAGFTATFTTAGSTGRMRQRKRPEWFTA